MSAIFRTGRSSTSPGTLIRLGSNLECKKYLNRGSAEPVINIPNIPENFWSSEKLYVFPKKLREGALSLKDMENFPSELIPGFIPSSCDSQLLSLKSDFNNDFVGSSSSMGELLSRLFLCIAANPEINESMFPTPHPEVKPTFVARFFRPTCVLLRKREEYDVWAIDNAPKDESDSTILADLGHIIEMMLGVPRDEFDSRVFNSNQESNQKKSEIIHESYRFSLYENFLVRSQLDFNQPNLSNTTSCIYDLKTRATRGIRFNINKSNRIYDYHELVHRKGWNKTYQLEIFDMARSAFLKYYFQAKLADMNGILVVFHNTLRMFGMQYFSTDTLAKYLIGCPQLGDKLFRCSIKLLNRILTMIKADLPSDATSALISFNIHKGKKGKLDIFVEPLYDSSNFLSLTELKKMAESLNLTHSYSRAQIDSIIAKLDRSKVLESFAHSGVDTIVDKIKRGQIYSYELLLHGKLYENTSWRIDNRVTLQSLDELTYSLSLQEIKSTAIAKPYIEMLDDFLKRFIYA